MSHVTSLILCDVLGQIVADFVANLLRDGPEVLLNSSNPLRLQWRDEPRLLIQH